MIEAQFINFLIGRLEALSSNLNERLSPEMQKAVLSDIQVHIKELKSVVKATFDKRGA